MRTRVARAVPRVLAEPVDILDEVTAVSLSPDGKSVLLGGSFSSHIVDVASGKTTKTLKPTDGAVWAARFTPAGLALGGVGDRFIAWDAKTGTARHTMKTNGIVRRISMSRDGKLAATSTWEKDVRLWDLAKGRELGGFTLPKSNVNGAALSPDGKLVACGGTDGFVRVFDARTGEMAKASAGKGWIDVVDRSDDGRILASAGRAAQVVLWDWRGEKLRTLTDMTTAITVLGVSPDGKWVAACGKKAAPLLWSTETGKVVAALEGHEKVTALAFAFDSRSIITAGAPFVRIWEAPS